MSGESGGSPGIADRIGNIGRTLSHLLVIFGFVGTVWATTIGPVADFVASVKGLVEAQAEISQVAQTNAKNLSSLIQRIAYLEASERTSQEPVTKFTDQGNSISNGNIGGFVDFKWSYVKLRDCGPPEVTLRFLDNDGFLHAFGPVSSFSAGRGVNSPVGNQPYTIKYKAAIPENEDVVLGPARGWAELYYAGCPLAPLARSPEVSFFISEKKKK